MIGCFGGTRKNQAARLAESVAGLGD